MSDVLKVFDSNFFNGLIERAKVSRRRRQHSNVHQSYRESCQRLFNAIEPDSYIRPHRHLKSGKDEMLIAIRGSFAALIFNDCGSVLQVMYFRSGQGSGYAAALELSSSIWHTIVSLESGSVLLEIKAGPFYPNCSKEFASWAPEEETEFARQYLAGLNNIISNDSNKVVRAYGQFR